MKYLVVLLLSLLCIGCQKEIGTAITQKHANGTPKTEITFLGDSTHLVSQVKYFPSGQVFQKIEYQEDGVLPKSEEIFYENCELKHAGAYKNDHRVGTWKAYFPTGQLQSMRNYNEEGKEEGVYQVYLKDGDYYYLYIQGFYRNGEKKGNWNFYNRDGDIIKTQGF